MRHGLVALLLAACANEPVVISPHLDVDVVVVDDRVTIYTGGTDHPCGCEESRLRFPAPGECISESDILVGCQCPDTSTRTESCLQDTFVTGSRMVQSDSGSTSLPWSASLSGVDDPVLVLRGCNQPDVEVPLRRTAPTMPIVTGTLRDGILETSWSPTPGPALVTAYWPPWNQRCVVAASSHTFDFSGGGHSSWPARVGLVAFDPPETIRAEYDTYRIWRGSSTHTYVYACDRDPLRCDRPIALPRP